MFLSIGMLKQKYFLTDIFILSAEKQPIKLSWRKIEWLRCIFAHENAGIKFIFNTLKLMLFLQIYKKGVLFFVETMNYSG